MEEVSAPGSARVIRSDAVPGRPRAAALGVWMMLGALLFVLGAAGAPGLAPGSVGTMVLGLWLVGALVISSRSRAARIERVWHEAMRSRAARFAAAAFAVYGILLAELLGVYGALAALCVVGLAGFILIPMGSADRLASRLTASALVVASLLLGLGAGEAVLRHPAVGAMLGTSPELEEWNQRYDRLWEQNVFGVRSRYETVARGPNSLRIVALGDSFTWGSRIASSDSTWPALLERRLAGQLGSRTVEVVNLGRNGFTTANEAEMLRRVGWQFDPDIVLLQFFMNDALPSEPNFKSLGSSYVIPSHRLIPRPVRRGMLEHSVLIDMIESQYSAWRNRSLESPWLSLYEDGRTGWEQLKQALQEVGEAAANRDVPAYFVVYPWFEPGVWTPNSYLHREIHERAIAVAEAAGFRIVDLTAVFLDARTDGRALWATPYDQHPSSAVNLVTARVLGDVLLKDGVVGPPHGPLRPTRGLDGGILGHNQEIATLAPAAVR